jgi:hypothetical protein
MWEIPMDSGSCLCGNVQYKIEGKVGDVVHCHCRTCQKAHASAFSSVADVQDSEFQLLSGTLNRYQSSPGKWRYFCGNCGTQIYAKREGTQHLILRMGSLDTAPDTKAVNHIWVSHKASWYEFADDLPKYEEFE